MMNFNTPHDLAPLKNKWLTTFIIYNYIFDIMLMINPQHLQIDKIVFASSSSEENSALESLKLNCMLPSQILNTK